jgi:DNA replication protein DnaC
LGAFGKPSRKKALHRAYLPYLLDILEDRTGERSTIITSQLPPGKWHDYVADPTLADALFDRLLHPARRLALKGPSRRKEASPDS